MFCNNCGKEVTINSKFCNYCGNKIIISEGKAVNKPIKEKTDSLETVWVCDYCEKEFSTKSDSDVHEKECALNPKNIIPKEEYVWTCDVCGKEFNTKEEADTHEKTCKKETNSSDESSNLFCPKCGTKIIANSSFCKNCGEKTVTELIIASSNRRFLNYFLDMIFSIIFAFLFALITGYILAFLGLYKEEMFNDEDVNKLFLYFSSFIYYLIFESILGKTPAKYLTKTKVVTELGNKPDFLMILKRSLTRFVPFDVFSFSGKNPIGWHDKWSKTRVIQN